MWRPRSYAEVQAALGVVVEDSQLDFKRELGSNSREVAKDIASMTIEGGVIAYGIDEQNGVASALPKVRLAGAPERIQQIVDTSIKPVPDIEIDVFPVTSGAGDGVVVVTVLPSPLAPHYANERFPARSGVTTRYLTEAEIDALYQQRRRLTEAAGDVTRRFGTFVRQEGISPNAPPGGAVMRLIVSPVATVRHTLGAQLGRALSRTVVDAAQTMSQYVDAHLTTKAFDLLTDWRPMATQGWQAGPPRADSDALADTVLVAATYTHSGSFSFQVNMSLVEGGQLLAFEHLWAVELMACLCIAGTFLRDVPGVGIVQCELELEGLLNAVSSRASRGLAFAPARHPAITEHTYSERGQFGVRQLSNDPRDAARLLLDRLLASFLDEGTDIVADVGRGIPRTA